MSPAAYLDECMNPALLPELRERGFPVRSASEAGMRGKSDREQLLYASENGLVIVTHNIRHYRRLHHRFSEEGRTHAGIVGIPQSLDVHLVTVRIALMLDWLGATGDYQSRFFTWGHLQFRLTQGFRLPGYSEAEVRLALGMPDR